MKTINIPFEDKEYKDLIKAKGSMSWRVFVLQLIKFKSADEIKREKDDNN